MTSAYCPAHITCFFKPSESFRNILERGSEGVGIRLGAGSIVHVDEIKGRTKVIIDGKEDEAKITRHVLGHMASGRTFEVNVECRVPPGQGFGMSASGAVAAALCLAEMTGKSRREAFEAAHAADAICGGGLGDVSGLMHEGDVPIRIKAGLPPVGRVYDMKLSFETMTVVVLGDKLSTAGVLGNAGKLRSISEAGGTAMLEFRTNDMTKNDSDAVKRSLFEISNKFSAEANVRGQAVDAAIKLLKKNGIRSAMCMLGNSIFTDAPEKEVREVLGEGKIFSTSSTNEPARIIQRV